MIKQIINSIVAFFTRKRRPTTLKGAINIVLKTLSKKERNEFKKIKEDDLILLHNTLGRGIRNTFSLWNGNPKLLKACGKEHPDDASFVIIEAAWKKLQLN